MASSNVLLNETYIKSESPGKRCSSSQEFNMRRRSIHEVLRGPCLKHFVDILLKLSPYGSQNGFTIQWFSETDLIDLSKWLFEDLHKQFERLLNSTSYLLSDEMTSCDSISCEHFMLLLRCCLIILQFLQFDLSLVLERCQILVLLAGKLCPPYRSLHFPIEPGFHATVVNSDPIRPIGVFSGILEVFLDNLLLHHDLRKHFALSDYIFSTSERLFAPHFSSPDEFQVIMEFVSSHFLLSVYDELSFNRFISRLSWSSEPDDVVPLLRLESALALLEVPFIVSAPHVLQAHLITLASTRIGVNLSTNVKKLDEAVISLYLIAFEISIKLYYGFMPILSSADDIIEDKRQSSMVADRLSFESCIRASTSEKLGHQIHSLVGFCSLHSHGLYSRTEEVALETCITYIEENQGFIAEEFKEEACSILNYIVEHLLPGKSKSLHEEGECIQEEIYCVAAVLKLMSSSLLQIFWFFKQNGYPGGLSTSGKEFDCLWSSINRFVNYSGGNQHIPINLFAPMDSTTGRSKEIKLMFSQFSSLLLLSLERKIDFLWKGSIFMMIILINFLILEEGNLDAFQPVVCEVKCATVANSSRGKELKDPVHNKSSFVIAANLKRARDLIQMDLRHEEDYRMDSEKITETQTQNRDSRGTGYVLRNRTVNVLNLHSDGGSAANGLSYISCLEDGKRNNLSEWEDLVDFIDCNPRKDYSNWLKNRRKFSVWKCEKVVSSKRRARRRKRELLNLKR